MQEIVHLHQWTQNVATVNENGIVTAKSNGTTIVKIYNERNNLYTAVKVNVNGKTNKTQPKLVGGSNFFVALKADGTVWSWGYNGYGQLGNETNSNVTNPSKISMKNVVDVAAGTQHTLLLKSDGTVWTTGLNNYGQLGDGTNINSNSFHKVKLNSEGDYLENIVAIAAGDSSSYALTKTGEVYSWGYNGYGQFGVDNVSTSYYPVKMQKVSNIIQISAGDNFLLMLDGDGSVWGVGANGDGQLGLNNTSEIHLPQQMLKENGSGILYGSKRDCNRKSS